MPFDISEMTQNIATYGLSPSDKFDVQIALPPALNYLSSTYPFINQFAQICPFRAITCSTPGASILTNDSHNLGIGPAIKQAFNATFPIMNITFLGDAQGIIESTISKWMNLIYNYSYNTTESATFYTCYRSDILSPSVTIRKYDKAANPISQYVIVNVLPLVFLSQNLAWENVNTSTRFTLQLHYTSYDIQTFQHPKSRPVQGNTTDNLTNGS